MATRSDYKTLVLYAANYLLANLKLNVAVSGRLLFFLIIIVLSFNVASGQVRVTISGKQLSMEHILKQIEVQTGYLAWMEDGVLSKTNKIDVDFQNLNVEHALEIIFRNQPLTYKVIGRTIVINRRKEDAPIRMIGGHVVSDGQPVENASVQIKGSSKGVITGGKGEFSLTAGPLDTILVVSCVGYAMREIIVDDRELQIELSKAVQELDEPVVIGYGTTSKRTNPGSVGTLNSKQIGIHPVTNPLLALQGRIPGLFIQQETGVTDGKVSVLIGGKSSIESYNEPFYVVDGVPVPSTVLVQAGAGIIPESNGLSYLNPQDIENISVLKDADATAIYGSRGANGVILITTKKGSPTKVTIAVSSSVGIGNISSKMKLLSTPEVCITLYQPTG